MPKLDSKTVAALRPWFPDLDMAGVRIISKGPVCWFVRNVLRQGAMTFSPFIFFGRDRCDPGSLVSVALLAHELGHVEQYRTYGHAGFLARYFRDLARNRFKYGPELPLEVACYSLQEAVAEALRPQLS